MDFYKYYIISCLLSYMNCTALKMEHKLYCLFFLYFLHITKASDINFKQKLQFVECFLSHNHQISTYIYTDSWSLHQKYVLSKSERNLIFTKGNTNQNKELTDICIYDFNNSTNINIIDNTANILLLSYDNSNYFNLLKPADTLPHRNLIIAKFQAKTTYDDFMVKIIRCYRLVENSPLIEEYLFTWTPGSTTTLNFLQLPRRRLDFGGLKLPVAIVLKNPQSINHLEDFRDPWIDAYSKLNYGPIMKLFNYYNITPEFKALPDYSHIKSKNKFVLTVSAPYMTKELLPYINFVKVAPATKLCYILRRPPTSFMTTIFTVTFSPGVWYATLGLVTILSTALYLLLNIETRRKDIKGQTKFSVYDLLLIGFEAICQQGTSTDPSSYSTRILTVLMFMALMFLYVAYSANILVLLQSTTPINNAQELIDFGIDYAGMDTEAYNYYNEDIAENLFKANIDANTRLSIEEGMHRVQAGLFAFFIESHYGQQYAKYYFTDYDVCGLQEFAARYDLSLGYTAIPKDSPYYELFKVGLFQIFEKGFSNRHYLRYFLKTECYSQGSSFDEIGIREIYQAILLVIMGIGCGLFLLCIEICINRFNQRKQLFELKELEARRLSQY